MLADADARPPHTPDLRRPVAIVAVFLLALLGLLISVVAVTDAARAAPREVWVSRTVTELVVGSGIEFEDQQDHELKGVPGTWRLFAVAP